MAQADRRLLGSHSQFHDDGRVVCRFYYLTPDHWQTRWDGISPLPATTDQVHASALAYARQRGPRPMQVSSAQLQSSEVDGVGEMHHYVVQTTPVGTPSFLPASFVEGGITVFTDLAGRVIEPELHEFATAEEYNAFMDSRHRPAARPDKGGSRRGRRPPKK